ncbi:hypothetical protein [Arenimonas oryziterrae]|uniref:Uncharacterized protein n=1 Tax=Arenimonas oryziterrae DSM 21050 = YC6267 TaxID=1121015 RepID=A0A091APX6_9GAMM|nr:hypothetical protein [Arenimonas oryziterrae]KFN41416.1 hypothetical protein N789_05940 [Arenimonas oryziterrae DSM 21050 = YC6267]
MSLTRVRDIALSLMALVGLYLLYFAPDRDYGWIGNAILIGSAWITFYLWSKSAPLAGLSWSLGEQLATLSLAFTGVVAVFFVLKMQQMGWQVTDLKQPGVRSLGRNIVLMLVLSYVLMAALRARAGQEAVEDERDRQIAARAAAHAHIVLVVALIGLVLNLGFGGSVFASYATPLNIAHWLIGLLIASILAEHFSAVWQYRRDRA